MWGDIFITENAEAIEKPAAEGILPCFGDCLSDFVVEMDCEALVLNDLLEVGSLADAGLETDGLHLAPFHRVENILFLNFHMLVRSPKKQCVYIAATPVSSALYHKIQLNKATPQM